MSESTTPTFYAVHSVRTENMCERVRQLRVAANANGVPFQSICEAEIDYFDLPMLKDGDILFNVGRGAERFERMLVHKGVVTFRSSISHWMINGSDTTIFTTVHDRIGLPGPKTVHHFPSDRSQLDRYIHYVNGPPVIFKEIGGTRGDGVILVNDRRAIYALAQDILDQRRRFIIREFIPHDYVLRVMVVGKEIIGTLRHPARKNDFRSSIDGTYELVTCSESVARLAVAALDACKYQFGGVDIIDDPVRGPLLLEVNPPCNFTSVHAKTGIDVADRIVKYLLAKSGRRGTSVE